MKHIVSILSALFLGLNSYANDAFYVWQQVWKEQVLEAVTNEPPTTIYPVVSVISQKGQSTVFNIPWEKLQQTEHRFVPTIRIPLKAYNRSDIASEIQRISRLLSDFKEIQLDLDCPERRLPEYATLLQKIRPELEQKISITALPSHLGNRSFAEVANSCEYYVLQVHGLDVPKNMEERAELMNMDIAERAIDRAEKLGRPYSIALPCYAYELNFAPETGKFIHLTAEQPDNRQNTIKRRITAKPKDLIQLHRKFQTLENARDIIWFRLPVEGDRLCLPRKTLAEIQMGNVPKAGFFHSIKPISETTFEIHLINENVIHASEVSLNIQWQNPKGSFDLYRNIIAPEKLTGRLPNRLNAPVPAPGSHIKLGWFSSEHEPEIEVKLK